MDAPINVSNKHGTYSGCLVLFLMYGEIYVTYIGMYVHTDSKSYIMWYVIKPV